ncbi:MAG: hypothetical protein U5K00_13410 [Melioribacteraceae bacterium]|nr:hypothetical protein [Melioribacteraceae bacterium]
MKDIILAQVLAVPEILLQGILDRTAQVVIRELIDRVQIIVRNENLI